MTDIELINLASKASGFEYTENDNPLVSDALALRLAVKLGISIVPYPIYQPEKHSVTTKQRRISDTMRKPNQTETIELYGSDKDAATRRAIVRAAAEIGKTQ